MLVIAAYKHLVFGPNFLPIDFIAFVVNACPTYRHASYEHIQFLRKLFSVPFPMHHYVEHFSS